jgi:hypothetical protein
MGTQQMTKLLLARMNASIKEHMQEMMARMEIDQEERKAERKAYQEDLMNMMEGILTGKQDKMDACQETEPDPGTMQYVGEHQEVPKEEAAVMAVGGLRKRRRDQTLAMRRHQKTKGRIRASRELWKKLAVSRREMTHRAKVAWRRGHDRKRYDQDNVAPRTPKKWTSRMGRWQGMEYNNGIRDRGLRQELLGIK